MEVTAGVARSEAGASAVASAGSVAAWAADSVGAEQAGAGSKESKKVKVKTEVLQKSLTKENEDEKFR